MERLLKTIIILIIASLISLVFIYGSAKYIDFRLESFGISAQVMGDKVINALTYLNNFGYKNPLVIDYDKIISIKNNLGKDENVDERDAESINLCDYLPLKIPYNYGIMLKFTIFPLPNGVIRKHILANSTSINASIDNKQNGTTKANDVIEREIIFYVNPKIYKRYKPLAFNDDVYNLVQNRYVLLYSANQSLYYGAIVTLDVVYYKQAK